MIVIDNGSDEPLEELISRYSFARLLTELQPGSYAARNKGLKVARGEILAFTDADCLPLHDWLETGEKCLNKDEGVDRIGGDIAVFPKVEDSPNAAELYDCIFGLNQRNNVNTLHFAATANMFTRRSVMDRVGPFRSDMKSSGDVEWGSRATDMGCSLIFADDAIVRHPARETLEELLTQARRHAGGRTSVNAGKKFRVFSGHGILTLLRAFVPNIAKVIKAWRHPRCAGTANKIRVARVILIIQYCKSFELIRTRLGGRLERR